MNRLVRDLFRFDKKIDAYLEIDFRETAPAAAFKDMYRGNVGGSVTSGLASGVPGDIKGLEYLHNKYGVSLLAVVGKMGLTI